MNREITEKTDNCSDTGALRCYQHRSQPRILTYQLCGFTVSTIYFVRASFLYPIDTYSCYHLAIGINSFIGQLKTRVLPPQSSPRLLLERQLCLLRLWFSVHHPHKVPNGFTLGVPYRVVRKLKVRERSSWL